MLKQIAKESLKVAGRRLPTGKANRVAILCYHSVHPSKSIRSADPDQFDEHMHWLSSNCECIPLKDVPTALESGSARELPVVAVTFDDGYDDNFEFAYPTLKKYRIPATFFLLSGLMENQGPTIAKLGSLWPASTDELRPMVWSQARELLAGGMDIGAHTYHHSALLSLPREEVRRELITGRECLEERLGRRIELFAYPFGRPRIHFDETTIKMVSDTGYRVAAGVLSRTARASDSALALPRFYIRHDSLEALITKVTGGWDLVGFSEERIPLRVLRRLRGAEVR